LLPHANYFCVAVARSASSRSYRVGGLSVHTSPSRAPPRMERVRRPRGDETAPARGARRGHAVARVRRWERSSSGDRRGSVASHPRASSSKRAWKTGRAPEGPGDHASSA
jgi:hypothetical protein